MADARLVCCPAHSASQSVVVRCCVRLTPRFVSVGGLERAHSEVSYIRTRRCSPAEKCLGTLQVRGSGRNCSEAGRSAPMPAQEITHRSCRTVPADSTAPARTCTGSQARNTPQPPLPPSCGCATTSEHSDASRTFLTLSPLSGRLSSACRCHQGTSTFRCGRALLLPRTPARSGPQARQVGFQRFWGRGARQRRPAARHLERAGGSGRRAPSRRLGPPGAAPVSASTSFAPTPVPCRASLSRAVPEPALRHSNSRNRPRV